MPYIAEHISRRDFVDRFSNHGKIPRKHMRQGRYVISSVYLSIYLFIYMSLGLLAALHQTLQADLTEIFREG